MSEQGENAGWPGWRSLFWISHVRSCLLWPTPPSHSLHTLWLSCMHLLNLPLTTTHLLHFYIDKLLNSLLILQSVGPHPYLDILFFFTALLFCCNVSRKNAPNNTSLPKSHPSFFISFLFLPLSLSLSLPFHTVGFISLMWAVFTPCLGWEEELIYGSL